jgi:receptor protein-tyrosine kinase
MKFKDLVVALKKRFWIIVVIVLVAALVSGVISRLQSPVYKAEMILAVTPPKNPTTKLPDATFVLAYAGAMPSIANACESLDVAEGVHERLLEMGIDIPAEQLLKKVSAEAITNSASVKVIVSDSSPTRATEIANTWGEVASQLYSKSQLLLTGELILTNRAIPPTKPTQPKPLVYLGIALFIGLMLGISLVVGMEYFDPHFRSPQETEELLGLPVMGTLPREKKSYSQTFLTSLPASSLTYEAYAELRTRLIFSRKEEAQVPIALSMALPMDDGPIIPINLATSIAMSGRRTLLVDADLRGQAVSRALKAAGRKGLADILERGGSIDGAIVKTSHPKLDLLAAGRTFKNPTDLLSLRRFEELIQRFRNDYEKVVLSTPPLSISVDAALVASKGCSALVVIDVEKCTRNIAMLAMESFQRLEVEPLGIILTNVKVRRSERTLRGLQPRLPEEEEAVSSEQPEKIAVHTSLVSDTRQPEEKVRLRERIRSASAGTFHHAAKVVDRPGEMVQRMKSMASEEARRLGKMGAPIPKYWLESLASGVDEMRESARGAVLAYCEASLERAGTSEAETKSIISQISKTIGSKGEPLKMGALELEGYLNLVLSSALPGETSR